MAHYAFLDENNIVTEVIVGIAETELIDGLAPEEWYAEFRKQKCVRTSYNNNIRKQFSGVGFTYDAVADVFIAPQPFPSWNLNDKYDWEPPIPYPEFGDWFWDEETISWVQ